MNYTEKSKSLVLIDREGKGIPYMCDAKEEERENIKIAKERER
jgi:hypothetical protein